MTHDPFARIARTLCVLTLCLGLGACIDENDDVDPWDFTEPTDSPPPEEAPRIEVEELVDFGAQPIGGLSERVLTVRNVGDADLELTDWTIADDLGIFAFTDFDDRSASSLPPGASLDVPLVFFAQEEGVREAELTVRTNDAAAPTARVRLRGEGLLIEPDAPCVAVDPEVVDFGVRPRGTTHIERVEVLNCSPRTPLNVAISTLEGPVNGDGFSFGGADGREQILQPGERATVVVQFSPRAPGRESAVLQVLSDDPLRGTVLVEVFGEGAPFEGALAAIRGTIDGRQDTALASPGALMDTLPLDRVKLDASESVSTDFPIARYEWSLIERPQDSAAALEGRPGAVTTEMFLDLSGVYVVQLDVWDERDVRGRTARLELIATPDEDIHIQLVWDTPNDPDQFDRRGADLDLHFRTTQGRWNTTPHDCHWQNAVPDWGVEDDPRDDPSLDIDDTDGWGPENINLDNPAARRDYQVGVHVFDDVGYGSSFATVRIYIRGQLRATYPRKRLRNQEFWHVADIAWPGGAITEIDEVSVRIPQK